MGKNDFLRISHREILIMASISPLKTSIKLANAFVYLYIVIHATHVCPHMLYIYCYRWLYLQVPQYSAIIFVIAI